MTKITVTQDDISKGEPNAPFSCPIARAIWRAFPGHRPRVGLESLSFYLVGRAPVEYELPAEAKAFIDIFDVDCDAAKPFEFEIGEPV